MLAVCLYSLESPLVLFCCHVYMEVTADKIKQRTLVLKPFLNKPERPQETLTISALPLIIPGYKAQVRINFIYQVCLVSAVSAGCNVQDLTVVAYLSLGVNPK